MKLFLSSLGIRVAVRGMATMVLIAGVLIAAGATPTAVRAATTITVNSASDAAANDGHCTLREAITSANTNTASGASGGECPAGALGADNIVFNIGGGGAQTITLASLLPTLSSSIYIDGTSQPGYAGVPLIRVDGNGLAKVFDFEAGSSGGTIKALTIVGATDADVLATSSNLTFLGNYIGTDGTSHIGAATEGYGLQLQGGGHHVGGTGASDGNLVAAAGFASIILQGDGSTVQGNLIGTNAAGSASTATAEAAGIEAGGSNNLIGGTSAGAGNLVSGTWWNIYLTGSSNTVQGNKIGTNLAGTAAITTDGWTGPLSNGVGVLIGGGSNNIIGGSSAGAGNLISNQKEYGIDSSSGTGTVIQGNFIGTNAAGTSAIANLIGIDVLGAVSLGIGGASAGQGNLISGSTHQGIYLQAGAGTVIQGNKIGTDVTGSSPLPNGTGIEMRVPATVGGASAGAGNLISGNTGNGITIQVTSAGTTIQGNYIGTNATGTAALSNANGILVDATSSATVALGGSTAGAGNLISGNAVSGISLQVVANGSTIQGNYVGTNAAGTAALPNANGIVIDGTGSTTVGGGTSGQGNLVSGNTSLGMQITGTASHAVIGNKLGTDITGSGAIPNAAADLVLTSSVSAQVSQNLIANEPKGDYGIYMDSTASFAANSTGNCIISNFTGLQNDSGSVVTFSDNWWGAASGPSGAGSGSGDWVSTNVTFTPWLTMPPAACEAVYGLNAPSDLTATGNGSTEIDLTWVDNSGIETAYSVEASADGSTGWTPLTTKLPADTTTYQDTSLSCGTTRYYRVFATSSVLPDSGYSNTANATTDPWNVEADIHGSPVGSHCLAPGHAVEDNYVGSNGGPAQATNTAAGNVVSSVRVLFGGSSYSEMMGFPNNTTTDFWFPWYNNTAFDSQFRVSNLGASSTTITVALGSSTIDSFSLGAGAAIRKNYAGQNSGPMHVSSSGGVPILATIRVLFGGSSYSEMMGFPNDSTMDFWFPWYNNTAMDSQFRVSNLGGTSTTITVSLGGSTIDSFTLPAGGAIRKNYAGQNNGPMHVSSSATPILATIRVLYGGGSYSEMMGFPDNTTTDFWFPWYDNVGADSQFRVSNLGGSSTTITVSLAGTPIDSFTLGAGAAIRRNYPSQNNGAFHITSSGGEPILATVRVLYAGTSFYEVMGYPGNALTSTQYFPWYNDVAFNSQMRIAVP